MTQQSLSTPQQQQTDLLDIQDNRDTLVQHYRQPRQGQMDPTAAIATLAAISYKLSYIRQAVTA